MAPFLLRAPAMIPRLILALVMLLDLSAYAKPAVNGRNRLRMQRQESRRPNLSLAGTPLPRGLRRVGHQARAAAGKTLSSRTWIHGEAPTLSIILDPDNHTESKFVIREYFGQTSVHYDVAHAGDKRKLGAAVVSEATGQRGMWKTETRNGGTRTLRAHEVATRTTLPSGRETPAGSWVVADEATRNGQPSRPARHWLWTWRTTPTGRSREKTAIEQRDFEAIEQRLVDP